MYKHKGNKYFKDKIRLGHISSPSTWEAKAGRLPYFQASLEYRLKTIITAK